MGLFACTCLQLHLRYFLSYFIRIFIFYNSKAKVANKFCQFVCRLPATSGRASLLQLQLLLVQPHCCCRDFVPLVRAYAVNKAPQTHQRRHTHSHKHTHFNFLCESDNLKAFSSEREREIGNAPFSGSLWVLLISSPFHLL